MPSKSYTSRLANHYEELAHTLCRARPGRRRLITWSSRVTRRRTPASQTAADFYAPCPRRGSAGWCRPCQPGASRDLSTARQVYMLLARYRRRLLKRSMRSHARVGDRQSEGEALADLALYHGRRSRGAFRRHRNWVKRRWHCPEIGRQRWWRGVLVTSVQWIRCTGNCWRRQKLEQALHVVGREASRMSSLMPFGGLALRRTGVESARGRLLSVSRGNEQQQTDTTVTSELWTQAFRCLAHRAGNTPRPSHAINDGLTKARTVTTCHRGAAHQHPGLAAPGTGRFPARCCVRPRQR